MPVAVNMTIRSCLKRAPRLASVAMLIALGGCMGFGGAKSPPPATTIASAPAAEAKPDPEAAGGAMLDVYRKQLPAARTLDKADDVYAERSAQLALEYAGDGAQRPWTNPDTGTSGTIKPTRTYQDKDGAYCREYDQTIQIRQRGSKDVKGSAEAKGGVACRGQSGKWKFLS
jgi:surface antigen